jgi:CHAT domain-containing protein/Tfp pilus assembly protein PilF
LKTSVLTLALLLPLLLPAATLAQAAVDTSGGREVQEATELSKRAYNLFRQNKYTEAFPLVQKALEIRENALGHEHPTTANSLDDMAGLYLQAGDYAKAESFMQRALNIREKVFGPEHPDTAKSLNSLARLVFHLGDYSKAEPLLLRALTIMEKDRGSEHLDTATSLNYLGLLYLYRGDFAKAEPLLDRALGIKEKARGPEHPETITSLIDQTSAYLRTGNFAKAAQFAERIGHMTKRGLVNGLDMVTLENLSDRLRLDAALIQFAKGDYANAEPVFQRNLRMIEQSLGSRHPEALTSLQVSGYIRWMLGDPQQALEFALKETDVQVSSLANTFSFTSEQQRLAYQQTLRPYDLLGSLGNGSALAEAVLHFKGVVLDSLLEDRLVAQASKDPAQREKVEQLKGAKQRLLTLTLETPKDVSDAALKARQEEREKLQREVEQMEGDLAREVAGLGRARRALSVEVRDVQRSLPGGAVLLEFIRYDHYLGTNGPVQTNGVRQQFEPRYGAVLLSSSVPPIWVPLGSAEAIEKNLAAYQQAVRGKSEIRNPKSEIDLSSLLRALHQQVWTPIETLLPKGTKTVILCPDGALNSLSFATLLAPDDRLLAQKYTLSYVASGRDLLRGFKAGATKRLSLYANPDFNGQGMLTASELERRSPIRRVEENQPAPAGAETGAPLVALREIELRDFRELKLAALPGTERESAALVSAARGWQWPTELFVAAEASEAQLRAVDSPRVLHLATHGFFLPDTDSEQRPGRFGNRGVGGISAIQTVAGPTTGLDSTSLLRPKVYLKNPMHRSGLALAGAQTTLEAWKRGDVPPTDNDGILTAQEVGALKLEGTWLVVLSACDTGTGEARTGEGVLGLRRGFIMAGAQNLLLTLWPVADEETAKFMVNFYEAAHQSGNAPQALADTQRDWLVRLRQRRGLAEAVRLAGPFILSSQGELK